MLHIILLILKIIGIILLALLALVLFIILCILFVPVRYKAKIEIFEEKHAKINISWLLHLVNYRILYDNGQIQGKLKILGIPMNKIKNLSKGKKTKNKNRHNQDNEDEEEYDIDFMDVEAADNQEDIDIKKEVSQNIQKNLEKSYNTEENYYKKKRKRFNIYGKIRSFIRKVKRTAKKIYTKIRKIITKKNNLIEFLTDEETKMTWEFSKTEIIKAIKKLLPRRMEADIKFGFSDPSLTGKVLGIIYMFYGRIQKYNICPDFENSVFEGNIKVKGKIVVFPMLITFFKFYKNKQFRNTINKAKQI